VLGWMVPSLTSTILRGVVYHSMARSYSPLLPYTLARLPYVVAMLVCSVPSLTSLISRALVCHSMAQSYSYSPLLWHTSPSILYMVSVLGS